MTKKEIVDSLSDKIGMHPKAINLIINSFMDEVKDSLETGESVFLRGFGTFNVVTRKEKKARDIHKNSTVIIPPTKVPVFKAVKSFKERIRNS